jgi:hypothetical protein
MDEATAIHQRLETAATARNLLFLAWREFAELQEKIMNGREKNNDSGNCFNPRIARKL